MSQKTSADDFLVPHPFAASRRPTDLDAKKAGKNFLASGADICDIHSKVVRGIQRSSCTPASFDLRIDVRSSTSFKTRTDDCTSMAQGMQRSTTKSLWSKGDTTPTVDDTDPTAAVGSGAHIVVIGALGNLGEQIALASRKYEQIGKVTCVVRDVVKAKERLTSQFAPDVLIREAEAKGYVLPAENAARGSNRDEPGATRRPVNRKEWMPTLCIVEGDVRVPSKHLKDDSPLQAAIASSDAVFFCASGGFPQDARDASIFTGPLWRLWTPRCRYNSTWDVDVEGALRMAHLCAQADAQFFAVTHQDNDWWSFSRPMRTWEKSYSQPFYFARHRLFERQFFTPGGRICPNLTYGGPLRARAYHLPHWVPFVSLADDSSTSYEHPFGYITGDQPHFDKNFRFSLFRASDLDPPGVAGGYALIPSKRVLDGHATNTGEYRDRSVSTSSPALAQLLMRSYTAHKSHIQGRVNVFGSTKMNLRTSAHTNWQLQGIPTQPLVDKMLAEIQF